MQRKGPTMSSNGDWEYDWKLTLPEDLVIDLDLDCPAPFENMWLKLESLGFGKCRATIRQGYSWDGCSVVPDAPGTKVASCFHDTIYQFVKDIAKAWGKSEWSTLYWANRGFLLIMRRDKSPVAGLYCWGVQIFGPAYHWIANLF